MHALLPNYPNLILIIIKKIVKRSPCSIEQLNPTSTNGVFCNTQIVNHNTQGLNMVRVRPNYIDLLRLLAL